MLQWKQKKETCDLDKNKLASKKAKMKFSTSPDLETVHDESSDVAIIQAATACQVVFTVLFGSYVLYMYY